MHSFLRENRLIEISHDTADTVGVVRHIRTDLSEALGAPLVRERVLDDKVVATEHL